MTYDIPANGYICQPRLGYWSRGIVTGWGDTTEQAWAKMIREYGPMMGGVLPHEACNIIPASKALLDMLARCGGHCGTGHVMLNGVACTVREAQDHRYALEAAHNRTGLTLGKSLAF
jgi:hypothetical protein